MRHITGGGRASVANPEFNWVNTLLGNVKNPITGTYHAICGQHAPRYLAAELEYRFNPDRSPRVLCYPSHKACLLTSSCRLA